MPHHLQHIFLELFEGLLPSSVGLYAFSSHVRGHNDDGLLEVNRAPLGIGQAPVIEDLQEDIEDVRVCLLYLVQKQHGIGPAPHGLGELAGLLVANIAWRRADEARDSMALLEFAHVDAHHRRLLAEEGFGQSARQLRLAYPGGPQEEEALYRTVGVREPSPGPADGLGHCFDSLFLADDPFVQLLFEAHEALTLLLGTASWMFSNRWA